MNVISSASIQSSQAHPGESATGSEHDPDRERVCHKESEENV